MSFFVCLEAISDLSAKLQGQVGFAVIFSIILESDFLHFQRSSNSMVGDNQGGGVDIHLMIFLAM
jgi:hypothetical protein